MKRTLLLALLCLLPITAKAQVGPISITSAQCATIAVGNNVSTIAVNISGTWTGTLQPQVSIQGQSAANIQVTPSTSSTAQSTITANGVYTAAVAGYDTFLLCGNTVASGTAVVNLNNSVARRGGISGSGGSGTVTSVATTSPITGGTITGTGTVACATCAIGPGSSTANHLAKFSGTDGVTLADGGAIPAGTVTSVATTSPIGGGTITGTGTVTCTTCTTATTPTAHGVILGAGSQALGVTAAGTTGQVLTGVTGADPAWAASSSPYSNLANTDGSSDTISAAGSYATTATVSANTLHKGSVIDVFFSGLENVQSGCNFQYGLVIDSTTIYTDIGHSSAGGNFFASGHWRFIVINTGASGTILQQTGTGESVVNQSNGGASNPFGYGTGSSASTTLDTTASHTIKVHGGGTYANAGSTTLQHLTVTQLN